MATTIQIDEGVKSQLDKLKMHHRESYNELIKKLIACIAKTEKKNQYDEFLHKIQQQKMKELWDNKEGKIWENA